MICENIIRIFLILSLFSSGEACDILKPQKHGDWFCPPSTGPATCHLECHPGYVSTNATVITCRQNHHQWSEAPECVTAEAINTGDAYRSNTVEVKQFELSDYKSTTLEEKIEMKTNGTLVKVTNELLTSKNDKMERQINELIEKTNALEEENKKINELIEKTNVLEEENKKINELIEKTNALGEENKKLNELNNQQKGLISKIEEKLVHVNGIVTMNQLDIEKHDKFITEHDQAITKHGQTISELDKVSTENKQNLDDISIWMQCSGSKKVRNPGNIFSPNYPDYYAGNYPANVDCSFTLIPRPGKSVHLEFTYFDTEICVDYVEMDPPIKGESKFCGRSLSDAPPTTTFDVNQQVTL